MARRARLAPGRSSVSEVVLAAQATGAEVGVAAGAIGHGVSPRGPGGGRRRAGCNSPDSSSAHPSRGRENTMKRLLLCALSAFLLGELLISGLGQAMVSLRPVVPPTLVAR